MKLSLIISRLQEVQKEFGDINITGTDNTQLVLYGVTQDKKEREVITEILTIE